MTDDTPDIVKRLRARALFMHGDPKMKRWSINGDLFNEAADEIARLRAQRNTRARRLPGNHSELEPDD